MDAKSMRWVGNQAVSPASQHFGYLVFSESRKGFPEVGPFGLVLKDE